MDTLKTCPNCKGHNSSHWPLGPCTVCKGSGWVTAEPMKSPQHWNWLQRIVNWLWKK